MSYYEVPILCPDCGIETQREGQCTLCYNNARAIDLADQAEYYEQQQENEEE